MLIDVTRDDIRKGRRVQVGLCPVALAVKRAVPEAEAVWVSGEDITVRWPRHRWTTVRAPRVVAKFVPTYDLYPHCWPFVRPFSFDLPLAIE